MLWEKTTCESDLDLSRRTVNYSDEQSVAGIEDRRSDPPRIATQVDPLANTPIFLMPMDPRSFDSFGYAASNPIYNSDPLGLFVEPGDAAKVCLAIPNPYARAAGLGLLLGIALADLAERMPHAEPRRPKACENCHDDPDPCKAALYRCLADPWMPRARPGTLPATRYPKYGPRKDCGACYRECRNNGGVWPSYKCPE
jgi:hypothetical protein